MRPFSLCLHCNLPLERPDLLEVTERVPERIRAAYETFRHCAGCGRIYWEGSHWVRMRQVLAEALDLSCSDVS